MKATRDALSMQITLDALTQCASTSEGNLLAATIDAIRARHSRQMHRGARTRVATLARRARIRASCLFGRASTTSRGVPRRTLFRCGARRMGASRAWRSRRQIRTATIVAAALGDASFEVSLGRSSRRPMRPLAGRSPRARYRRVVDARERTRDASARANRHDARVWLRRAGDIWTGHANRSDGAQHYGDPEYGGIVFAGLLRITTSFGAPNDKHLF